MTFLPLLGCRWLRTDLVLKDMLPKEVASSSPKLLSLIIFIQGKFAKELPSFNISLEELRTSELDMLQKMTFFSISDHFVLWASSPVVLHTSVKHFVQMLPWCTVWRLYRNSSQSWSIKWIQSYWGEGRKTKRGGQGHKSIHSTERDCIYFRFSFKNGFIKQRVTVWAQQSTVVIHVMWALQ